MVSYSAIVEGIGASEMIVSSQTLPRLYSFTAELGKVTREVKTEESVYKMKRARYMVCANSSGTVSLKDPRSLRTEHTFIAHTARLVDLDVCGELVATCGFSQRFVWCLHINAMNLVL